MPERQMVDPHDVVMTGENLFTEMRGDRQSSSACLAWSETWVKPRG